MSRGTLGALLREIDIPPVWLLAGMGLAWGLAEAAPLAAFGGPAWRAAGWALVALGLALAVWAAAVMTRAGVNVLPRRAPAALVRSGPFRYSRNPIYLGDALILTGWCLTLGAASALIAPPLFVAWISRRFIAPEEAALRAAHPEGYAAWSARVRRWI